jgi:hypothetical protein
VKIEYIAFENPALQCEVATLIEKYKKIIPPWILRVRVVMCANQENSLSTVARATLDHDYMSLALEVYARWTDQSDEKREETIKHEIIHSITNYQFNFAMNAMDNLVADENVRRLVKQQMTERVERTTCWLTSIL